MPSTAEDQIRDRIARIEELIGQVWDHEEYTLVGQIEELSAKLDGFQQLVMGRIESIETDLSLVKKALAESSSTAEVSRKMRVPEPKVFGGARDAKELENFLWDMEQYFVAARVPDAEKVTLTSMYMSGDAKLWWRSRLDDDEQANRERIATWDMLKKELRDQFLPCNTAWVARDALKKLSHTGTVREYVKQFNSLMLEIKNMSEDDKLFNFMSGLQPWAQTELRRQGVKDLKSAMVTAESLVDHKITKEAFNGAGSSKSRDKDWKGDKGGHRESQELKQPETTKEKLFKGGCFICGEPHRARSCPKKERLSAIVADEGQTSGAGTSARLGCFQLLNSIQIENGADTQTTASTRASSSRGGGGLLPP